MNYFYITGTSRGIGKAIAEELLKDKENYVFGLGRSKSIRSQNYKHIHLNLSDLTSVKQFEFSNHPDAEKVVLINNSGILGPVDLVGKLDNDSIIECFNINIIGASILMNKFIGSFKEADAEKQILNISSGAGRHPIESWSTYCATKSAMDMMSEVIYTEQKRTNRKKAIHIFSIAPGVVETQMQDEIRTISKEKFADVDRFIEYKEKGFLTKTEKVANQILDIISNPRKHKSVLLDLRSL